jgi:hypothetical protein
MALAVVVVLAYAPTLSNELVWDDLLHIVDNQHVRSFGAARVYLERSEGAYFRPLVFLGYAVEHATWGTAALGYHLVNLLLHLANVFLLRGVGVPQWDTGGRRCSPRRSSRCIPSRPKRSPTSRGAPTS